MFIKAALTFLAIGAFSVNALTTPVARSPAPEPEAQELEAWMLKRDLSYDLFSRELQALDGLFSREPEDWAQWAKRGAVTSRPEPAPPSRQNTIRPPSRQNTAPNTDVRAGTPHPKTGFVTDPDGKMIKTD